MKVTASEAAMHVERSPECEPTQANAHQSRNSQVPVKIQSRHSQDPAKILHKAAGVSTGGGVSALGYV